MKKQILDKSLYLINKNGLEDFSMRKLAKALDIQTSTIYYYYKNKSELLCELYINTASLFFDDENFNHDNLEDDIYYKAKLIQENKDKFIFLIKYRKAIFLDEDSRIKFKERFKDILIKNKKGQKKYTKIDHILMMGPLVMLAISDDDKKLNDKELIELALRICKSYKEE